MFISYSPSQRSPELPTSAAAVIRATISATSASLYHRRPCHCRSCAHQDLALATTTVILVCTIAPCTFQSAVVAALTEPWLFTARAIASAASAAALTEPSVSLHHARTSPVCSLPQPEPPLPGYPCPRFSHLVPCLSIWSYP